MANRIVGLKNIHIAEKVPNGYRAPVRLVGAKSFSTSNDVSETAFYSDDVMDHYSKDLKAIELEIELAYLTPEIEALITGKTLETATGALVSKASDKQKSFAIIYEMTTLAEPIRRVIYDCILSVDEKNSTTKTDGVEEQLVKLSGKAKPDANGVFDAVMDKNHKQGQHFDRIFDAFFTDVQLPTALTSGTPSTSVTRKLEIEE